MKTDRVCAVAGCPHIVTQKRGPGRTRLYCPDHASGPPKPRPPERTGTVVRWEYMRTTKYATDAELTKLGTKGWEIVAFIPLATAGRTIDGEILLKREVA